MQTYFVPGRTRLIYSVINYEVFCFYVLDNLFN